jgi:2-keto-4-pentenoate hydratase/2-oxohepta-3-ene-1,7-dioic acid hydratase in catechol pathway
MKLCRFDLLDAPGHARSGIFLDNRVYETEGLTPVGVHELGGLRLLSPVGTPPALRAFTSGSDGRLRYQYLNPGLLHGPLGEVEAPDWTNELDLEVSLGVVVQDFGRAVDADEAQSFILGFTTFLAFVATDVKRVELAEGCEPVHYKEVGFAAGPFLVTPDSMPPLTDTASVEGQVEISIRINRERAWGQVVELMSVAPARLVEAASRYSPIFPGELLVAPPWPKPPLPETHYGQYLRATDSVAVSIEGLDSLHVRLV